MMKLLLGVMVGASAVVAWQDPQTALMIATGMWSDAREMSVTMLEMLPDVLDRAKGMMDVSSGVQGHLTTEGANHE